MELGQFQRSVRVTSTDHHGRNRAPTVGTAPPPKSEAICARGFLETRTNSTACSRNSESNLDGLPITSPFYRTPVTGGNFTLRSRRSVSATRQRRKQS